MRLFVAYDMPSEVKEYLKTIQAIIPSDYAKFRLTSENQMHVTLKFLGVVPENKIGKIKVSLQEIKYPKFSNSLSIVGVFPNFNYPRVAWVGIKPEKETIGLQKLIEKALPGFKQDHKFHPHITLGRVVFVRNKREFSDSLKKIEIEEKKIDVNEFKLIQSTLTPNGPMYKELAVYPLN